MQFRARLVSVALFTCALAAPSLALVSNNTQGTSFATIQAAIDAAANGDLLLADPGVYQENIDFLGKAITLESVSDDPTNTIIMGDGTTSVVSCVNGESYDTILSGFTITGGFSLGFGAGMINDGTSPTVFNCIFEGNSTAAGAGAIYNNGGQPEISNCIFRNNSTPGGGGAIANESALVVIANCVFDGNQAGLGGAIYNSGGTSFIYNCTFANNTASSTGGAMRNAATSTVYLINCIFWGDAPDEMANSAPPYLVACDIQGGIPPFSTDAGQNISSDPLFVDPLGPDGTPGNDDDDLHLLSGSPCIDAANDSFLPYVGSLGVDQLFFELPLGAGVPFDLDLNVRALDDPDAPSTTQDVTDTPNAPIPDDDPTGAFDTIFVSGVSGTVQRLEVHVDITHTYIGDLTITLRSPGNQVITLWDQECGPYEGLQTTFGDGYFPVDCDSPATGQALSFEALGGFFGVSPNGAWTLHVVDNAAQDTGTLNSVTLSFRSDIVDMGAYEGARAPAPAPTFLEVPLDVPSIQDAIDQIADDPGSEILVDPGTYFENIDLRGKAFALVSGSGNPADTIIDGSGAGPVVTCNSGEGPGTVLRGFTITNGSSSSGAGMVIESSSPSVTNCDFVNNVGTGGSIGGGIGVFDASPAITNCRFLGNSANQGAGIGNLAASPTVTNCVFSANQASQNGGGIANISGSDALVTNCTFSMNAAGESGGATYDQTSAPRYTNSIFWGDTPQELIAETVTTITYCDIQGGEPIRSVGNFSADPLFFDADGPDNIPGTADDDLRLQNLSPCIDAGHDGALPSIAEAGVLSDFSPDAALNMDLRGGARVFGSPIVSSPFGFYVANVNAPIPDNDAVGISATIDVSGAGGTADRVEVGTDITHTYVGDLEITVQSPQGTTVTLWNRECSAQDNMQPVFGDGFPVIPCADNFGPFAPSFEQLGAFAGEDPNGQWTITVSDLAAADTGTLNTIALFLKPSEVDLGAYENHSACIADINADGTVDVFDFGIFATNFFASVTPGTHGDLDGSGVVDVFDFGAFASDFFCQSDTP